MAEVVVEKKYRVAIIDTINQLMNDLHIKLMEEKGRGATHDEWRDFGVDVLDLYNFIKSLPNTIPVGILGYEGSGKTVGGSFLNPDETYWLNIDKKPLTFIGGKQKYNRDKKNYKVITGYKECKETLTAIHANSKEPLIVFIMGHIEDYKAKGVDRQRLKVIGKMATKYNIEGALSHTYYTYVDEEKKHTDPARYQLRTVSVNDTARSPMGMWETEFIPNNLQLIVDAILKDYNGE
jgi:hypothetical protein